MKIHRRYRINFFRKPNHLPAAVILDSDIRSQEGIIQPLGRRGIPIIALSNQKDCPAFHSKYVVKCIISPSIESSEEEYIEFLINLPVKGVLFYSHDLCAVTVSRHQKRLQGAGFLLNIASSSSIETVFDKWGCFQIAKSLNIPMAKSRLVKRLQEIDEIWDDFQKPVILKGTRLAGGEYYKVFHRDQLPAAWMQLSSTINSQEYKARKSEILIQEWHSFDMKDNWSCETVYTKESTPVGFFTIKRIRCSLNPNGTFSSRLFAGNHEENDQLKKMTKKILSSINWKGFAHVEYFYVPGEKKYFLTEVNPRLPGYSYYPGIAGFDMAYYYYADLVGMQLYVPSSFPESIYFESFHYPGDITEAFNQIPKGRINLLSFIRSYLQLFLPGRIKVIDPIRLDNPVFTIRTQLSNIKRFFIKCYRFFLKKR